MPRLRTKPATGSGWNVGIVADGSPLIIPARLHLLVAGLSRAGKSTLLRCIIARAACEPVALVLVDAKRVELTGWRPRATAIALDQIEAIEKLEQLTVELDDRFAILETETLTTWADRLGPRILVVVDELALIVAGTDRRLNDRAIGALRRVLAIGAAAGVTVIGATQRPSHDVLPASIRDLFQCRVGFAAGGETWDQMLAMDGAELHLIPVGPEHAGRCKALVDGERVARPARVCWLTPERAAQIAHETAHLRPTLLMGDRDAEPAQVDTNTPTTDVLAGAGLPPNPPPHHADHPTATHTTHPRHLPGITPPTTAPTPNPTPTPPHTITTTSPPHTTTTSISPLDHLDHAILAFLTTTTTHTPRSLYNLIRPHLTTSRTTIERRLAALSALGLAHSIDGATWTT